jgi:hypothetical protein
MICAFVKRTRDFVDVGKRNNFVCDSSHSWFELMYKERRADLSEANCDTTIINSGNFSHGRLSLGGNFGVPLTRDQLRPPVIATVASWTHSRGAVVFSFLR